MGEKTKKSFVKKLNELFAKLKKSKKAKYVLVAVLVVLVVVILFWPTNKKTKSKNVATLDKTTQNSQSGYMSYCEEVEHKLESVISCVSGCSNVRVMVMTEGGVIRNIAEESETKSGGSSSTTTRNPVYEVNGSSKTPYVIYETYPKIVGVLVVAKGAGDAGVRLKLIRAVEALTGIDASKIEILEGK